jgi:predicted transcriptional regulator
MSQNLTIKLPDEIYMALKQLAPDMHTTVEKLAVEWVSRYAAKPQPKLTKEAQKAAWERLQRHMGAENLGYPTGASNEAIDADLAQEYGNDHE